MKVAKLVSLATLFLLVLATFTVVSESTVLDVGRPSFGRAFISQVLLEDRYWFYGAYVEDESLLSITPPGEEFVTLNAVEAGRVLIVMDREAPIGVLRGKVAGLLGVFPTHLYNVVYAVVTRDKLAELAHTPGILAVLPDIRVDALINRDMRLMEELLEHELQYLSELLQATGATGFDYHYTVNITRARDVWTEFNIRGENVTIAIIDTGVDYGSPGLGLGSIARDEFGLPMVFDASSLGLVLTPVEAVVGPDGYITINVTQLYVFWPPYYVYKWNASLFVRITGCRSWTGWIPFPADNRWHVGGIVPPGSKVRFGLAVQLISFAVAGVSSRLDITLPVLVVDSDGDGHYDTVYVDTTTVLNLTRMALAPAPCSVVIPGTLGTVRDFSFADETPVRYGSEVIARDLDGDGLNDVSFGTLAGYVYDAAFVIILEKLGVWRERVPPLPPLTGYSTTGPREVWRYEPVALVWPGLDPYGDYVVLQYDYHSHGTYCATTAAGRDFMAQTGYGVRSIAGQAPATKIASSPALYYGTVAVSVYFFSGFDIVTPYGEGSIYIWPTLLTNPWIAFEGWTWRWEYTGLHQADITSNSYGASGWALWGWNTGMDPSSAMFDYTILVSGTLHFVAVGNGGPGFGTIATPGSSTLAVGVGATTEFTYRPAYAYHWPGSSRRVITWSNRGPTELGVVKPDITAVGSFAWAIGRTWDALNNLYVPRHLRGNGSFALFSGTSQATPMVAGASALVISMYKSLYKARMPAPLLKTLIMNYAHDMGFDELSQGTGFVDAYAALKALVNNYPLVYSTSILTDLLSETSVNVESMTYGATLGPVSWYEPKIFIPAITPGGLARRPLTILGSGAYRAYAVRLEKVAEIPLCDVVTLNINPPIIVACSGDRISLNITAASVFGHLAVNSTVLNEFDFFEIEVILPFELFETGGRTRPYNLTIGLTHIEIAYWIDTGADRVFSWLETGRIMYDIRRANAVRIQMSRLKEQLEEIEHLSRAYMDVDPAPLPKHVVIRLGVSGATYRGILPVRARLVGYKLANWSDVVVVPSTYTIRDRTPVELNVVVRAPVTPGFYSGYVVVEETTRGFKYLVPLSFFVPVAIRTLDPVVVRPYVETTVRRNTYLRGTFDYTWRYESGDWRVFKVIIPVDYTRVIWALGIRVTWPLHDRPEYASNIDVHFYGPYTYSMVEAETRRVYTVSVNGVQLAAELTRDPAGWGGFNPTRFWDSIRPDESIIVAPVTSPGVYRVVVRNIQFRGLTYEEPFTLELYPVAYSIARAGDIVRIAFRTPLVHLLPAAFNVSVDGVLVNSTGFFYVSNLSELDIAISIKEVEFVETRREIRVYLEVKTGVRTPRGLYIVPLEALMKVPVTTVGWLEAGTRTTYFEWYSIPVLVQITHR